jgi:hypothetical protein
VPLAENGNEVLGREAQAETSLALKDILNVDFELAKQHLAIHRPDLLGAEADTVSPFGTGRRKPLGSLPARQRTVQAHEQ